MERLTDHIIDYSLATELFEIDEMKSNLILPMNISDMFLSLAVAKESSYIAMLEDKFGLPVKCNYFTKEEILYELCDIKYKSLLYKYAFSAMNNKSDQKNIENFIVELLTFAINKNASDIHIETLEDSLIVRIRVDGELLQVFKFKYHFFALLSSVIKVLSNLDISQKRLPQNSRFTKYVNGMAYDFRVSIIPTISGESIVIRILNLKNISPDLEKLGFNKNNLNIIIQSIKTKQGMILVTGPTGSGKTTTLYSILKRLNELNKKIITIEDPVEYKVDNIQQINIDNELGLTYEEALKNILRQDPDILLIGEIRDRYALQIAIQASLTGHLVFATLHTKDAINTINRLLDLEAEPFLISATLKTIISQRLIRKLCTNCKQKSIYGDEELYISKGCQECNLTGYKNRELISEVLEIDDGLASMISNGQSIDEMLEYSLKHGYKHLKDDGLKKIYEGVTSKEELLSNIRI